MPHNSIKIGKSAILGIGYVKYTSGAKIVSTFFV